jgi:hypothetical protein
MNGEIPLGSRSPLKHRAHAMAVLLLLTLGCWAILNPRLQLLTTAMWVRIHEILTGEWVELMLIVGTTLFALLLLRRGKWILAIVVLLLGLAGGIYHASFELWLRSIGADSFEEAKSFSLVEAKFWLNTMSVVIHPNPLINLKHIAFFIALALAFMTALRWLHRRLAPTRLRYDHLHLTFALLLILLAVHQTFAAPLRLFLNNVGTFKAVQQNFNNPAPPVAFRRPLHVVMYIGESTTVMNMSLYGYPRDTTPRLTSLRASDPNLLVFENVFSTHSQTSMSLLEALSFGLIKEEYALPITERKRVSIVELLAQAGIKPVLYSNQGQAGTINQASSIIFRKAERHFSLDDRLLGNLANLSEKFDLKRPWDHDFFVGKAAQIIEVGNRSSMTFLHSYAGHGWYLKNIPPNFRQPVDDYFLNLREAAVGAPNSIRYSEGYDAALRYVDYSVSSVIDELKPLSAPVVFLYFSDHGEATYEGRGHDSMRFVHEMVRIPFVMYFNQSAREKYPDLYQKYQALSRTRNVATLNQLSSTLLDLFGAEVMPDASGSSLLMPPVIGTATAHPPLMVRKISEGIMFIDINPTRKSWMNDLRSRTNEKYLDRSDMATHVYAAVHNHEGDARVCYPANTLSDARRGSIVTNCLGVNIVVNSTGEIAAHAPDQADAGLRLEHIATIAHPNKLTLWLEGKNIATPENCSALVQALDRIMYRDASILINFPTPSNHQAIARCAMQLRDMRYRVSYKISPGIALKCTASLNLGMKFDTEESCQAMATQLMQALASGIYTDLSFDYRALEAVKQAPGASKLVWNTENLDPKLLGITNRTQFGMMALNTRHEPETTASK